MRRRCLRGLTVRRTSWLVVGIVCLPVAVYADTVSFSGGWSSAIGSKTPAIPTPAGRLNTTFAAPYGPFVWNYSLYSFTVTQTGSYTATIATTPVTNTSYFLTGPFSPSTTNPATPLSNFLYSIFSSSGTAPYSETFSNMQFSSGQSYSLLIAYNVGGTQLLDRFSFSMTGAGCAAFTGINTCTTTILAGTTALASQLGATITPTFQGGTLTLDQPSASYAQNFTFDGSGTNVIDQAGNMATFSGVFSNATPGTAGTLTISNSGSGGEVILTGTITAGGAMVVNNGALLADNGMINAASLRVDGTLRGTGTITAPTTVNGRLAPGNSPGTLTFAAPVTLAPGAITEFDIDGTGTGIGAGNYSRVLVTGAGNSFTANGTLLPLLRGITGSASNTYTPPIGQAFQVINAQGGVSGSFTGLAQPAGLAAGTRFDALYAPASLSLVVTPAAYGNLAAAGLSETAGEQAVGRALDAIRPAAGVRMSLSQSALFAPLYALPGAAVASALDGLSPGIYGAATMAGAGAWYQMAGTVGDQMAMRRAGSASPNTAPGPYGSTIWAEGLGQFTNVGGDGGYHASMGGGMAGIDIPVVPGARLGVAVGGGSVQANSGASNASGTAVQFAAYGGYSAGPFFMDGQLAYMHLDEDVRRDLGLWASTARGNGAMHGGGGQVHAGVALTQGRFRLEPTLGMSVMSMSGGALTESTGGALAERIGGDSMTSAQSLVALRGSTRIAITPAIPVLVHALVGWQHEFLDTTTRSSASLALLGSGSFDADTAPISRDAARLGAGFDVTVSRNVSLYGGYQAVLGRNTTAQYLTGGLRVGL